MVINLNRKYLVIELNNKYLAILDRNGYLSMFRAKTEPEESIYYRGCHKCDLHTLFSICLLTPDKNACDLFILGRDNDNWHYVRAREDTYISLFMASKLKYGKDY